MVGVLPAWAQRLEARARAWLEDSRGGRRRNRARLLRMLRWLAATVRTPPALSECGAVRRGPRPLGGLLLPSSSPARGFDGSAWSLRLLCRSFRLPCHDNRLTGRAVSRTEQLCDSCKLVAGMPYEAGERRRTPNPSFDVHMPVPQAALVPRLVPPERRDALNMLAFVGASVGVLAALIVATDTFWLATYRVQPPYPSTSTPPLPPPPRCECHMGQLTAPRSTDHAWLLLLLSSSVRVHSPQMHLTIDALAEGCSSFRRGCIDEGISSAYCYNETRSAHSAVPPVLLQGVKASGGWPAWQAAAAFRASTASTATLRAVEAAAQPLQPAVNAVLAALQPVAGPAALALAYTGAVSVGP